MSWDDYVAPKTLSPRKPGEGALAYVHRLAIELGYIQPDAEDPVKRMPAARVPGQEG